MAQPVSNQLKPSGTYANKPLDERCTVNRYYANDDDAEYNIRSIESMSGAYIGLHVYVTDVEKDGTDKRGEYVITKLTSDKDVDMTGVKTLNEYIGELDPNVPAHVKAITQQNITDWNNSVPNTRTVNGKALSSNVQLTPSDVGAQPTIDNSHKLSADNIEDGSTNKVVTETEKAAWNGKQDALNSTQLANIDKGGAALQPVTTAPEDNFVAFDYEGNIKNSGCNESTFIKGVKQNGTSITPLNGVVDITMLSAYEQWLDENGYDASQHGADEFLESLKAHISNFIYEAYDTDAAGDINNIGDAVTSNSGAIGNTTPSASTKDVILLMPNNNAVSGTSAADATMMFATIETSTPGEYKFVYVGSINDLDASTFVKKSQIVNDPTTGGSSNVLSAEAGKALKGDIDELDLELNGGTVISNTTDGTTVWTNANFYVSASSFTWTIATNAVSKYIDLQSLKESGFNKIRIKANSSKQTNYTLFNSNFTPNEVITSDYTFKADLAGVMTVSGEQKARISIPAGEEKKIDISDSDIKYIVLAYTYSSDYPTSYLPAEINILKEEERSGIIYDGLKSDDTTKALSAKQGSVLKEYIESLQLNVFGGTKILSQNDVDLTSKIGTSATFYNGYMYGIGNNRSYYIQLDLSNIQETSYIRVKAKSTKASYVTFLKTDSGLSSNSTPSYSDIMNGVSSFLLGRNEERDFKLSDDMVYMVLYNRNGSGEDGQFMPQSVQNIEKEVVESKINIGKMGITHLTPDNEGQLNVVKRMRKLTDCVWTPVFDFDRFSSGGGKRYCDKFLKGKTYKGIPYGRATRSASALGYSDAVNTGFKIGSRISLETFFTAVSNRGTVVEDRSEYNSTNVLAGFYANTCSGSVSAVLGIDFINSDAYYNVPTGFTSIGLISSLFDVKLLKLGDVMATASGAHTVMITDVIVENGYVKYVEVSESTVSGNENYDELGSPFGGIARRLWWSTDENRLYNFFEKWDGYKVVRYNNIANLTYTPSPYAPLQDETHGYAQYNMAVLPYMGNAFRYVVGYVTDSSGKLVVEVTGKTHIHIKKLNEGVWEDYGDNNGLVEINYAEYNEEVHPYVYVTLPTSMEVGRYRAYACVVTNGEESEKTKMCNWDVVSQITNLEDF